MANGYRRTVAPRQGDGAIELVADIGFILRIVEKHFALNHLHAGTLRGAHGLGVADGDAVEKIEIVALQGLHHLLHAKQVGGHRAAHMVIQPDGVRDFAVSLANNALDLLAAHFGTQGVFFQRLFAERCHWQVDEHFMALIMRFSGHFPGVRRVRQHGDGDSCRQRQHLILGLRAVAKIVNNDGEFASERWRRQSQRTGYGKSNCAKLKQNLSSQPRLWIDRLTLTTNFEIE